jgi:hypothetical protein
MCLQYSMVMFIPTIIPPHLPSSFFKQFRQVSFYFMQAYKHRPHAPWFFKCVLIAQIGFTLHTCICHTLIRLTPSTLSLYPLPPDNSTAFSVFWDAFFIHRYNILQYYSLSFPFPFLPPPVPSNSFTITNILYVIYIYIYVYIYIYIIMYVFMYAFIFHI